MGRVCPTGLGQPSLTHLVYLQEESPFLYIFSIHGFQILILGDHDEEMYQISPVDEICKAINITVCHAKLLAIVKTFSQRFRIKSIIRQCLAYKTDFRSDACIIDQLLRHQLYDSGKKHITLTFHFHEILQLFRGLAVFFVCVRDSHFYLIR